MAHWHSLAKLRLHTDDTLDHLDKLTTALGEQLRTFQKKTCSAFQTTELPRETRARNRQQARRATQKGKRSTKSSRSHANPEDEETPVPDIATSQSKSGRKSKVFNLHTYKNHSLGDYVEMIRKYGTTDSYNTELVRHRS